MWNMRKVTVISVVVDALGMVSKDLEKSIEKIGVEVRVEVRVEHLQKSALLGTARILRMVLQ